MNRAVIFVSFWLLGVALGSDIVLACHTPAPVVEQGVIDIVDAACTLAESQPEPDWVYYLCTVAGAPPHVAKQYTLRVPKPQAAEFERLHGIVASDAGKE